MRPLILPVLTSLALSSCAVGGAPAPEAAPYAPSFSSAPEVGQGSGTTSGAGGRDDGDGSRARGDRDRRSRGGDRDASGDREGQESRGSGDTGPARESGPGPGSGPATSARLSDPSGDVSGIEQPAYADLVGADLRRGATGWTLVVDLAGTVPERTTGDRVLDLTLWVDRDGDGTVDDEVLAQLGGGGWTTAYREPERARYGSDSEVEVRPDGARVVVTMPPGHLGGVETLQWAVSTELGTLASMAAGTASRDSAPDASATAFPG